MICQRSDTRGSEKAATAVELASMHSFFAFLTLPKIRVTHLGTGYIDVQECKEQLKR